MKTRETIKITTTRVYQLDYTDDRDREKALLEAIDGTGFSDLGEGEHIAKARLVNPQETRIKTMVKQII